MSYLLVTVPFNLTCHSGFAAPAGRGYGSETVHRVCVNCDDVEMAPVHRSLFVLLCVTVLDVKASVVVSCVGVSRDVCAVVWVFSCMF